MYSNLSKKDVIENNLKEMVDSVKKLDDNNNLSVITASQRKLLVWNPTLGDNNLAWQLPRKVIFFIWTFPSWCVTWTSIWLIVTGGTTGEQKLLLDHWGEERSEAQHSQLQEEGGEGG